MIRSLFQKLNDVLLNWNRLAAEAHQSPDSRCPDDQMILTGHVDPGKQVVTKEWNDLSFILARSGHPKSREKSLHSFEAEMKLRLLFFVWIAVDDVPMLGQSVHLLYSD